MKRCIECNHPIDNDYNGEVCPSCEAPLVSEEIVEEFLDEDGVPVDDIEFDDDDEFDDNFNDEDLDEDLDEDDDLEEDLEEE